MYLQAREPSGRESQSLLQCTPESAAPSAQSPAKPAYNHHIPNAKKDVHAIVAYDYLYGNSEIPDEIAEMDKPELLKRLYYYQFSNTGKTALDEYSLSTYSLDSLRHIYTSIKKHHNRIDITSFKSTRLPEDVDILTYSLIWITPTGPAPCAGWNQRSDLTLAQLLKRARCLSMADIKSPEERSCNMSLIKEQDTKPEIYLRKLLFSKGYRYRKNYSKIIGHPDIWMSKYNTAIFIHGCFWHRHLNCKYAYEPKSNIDFWRKKFDTNVTRDKNVKNQLISNGIKCIIVWKCTIKRMQKDNVFAEGILASITAFLDANQPFLEL